MTVQTKEEKLADAKVRVRDAFITFEHREGSRLVDVKELPTVMRSLGMNASGLQLKPLMDSLQTEESSHISLDAFENAAAKFLIDYEATVLRDDYHMLVRLLPTPCRWC
jgi:Ca2+-binding EF-hand superfamily protein